MIYKNYSETAKLLAEKIRELTDTNVETFCKTSLPNKIISPKYSLTFISSESEDFAKKVAEYLDTSLTELVNPKNLIIIDNGATLAVEYNEFTNEIRKAHPTTKIILAIPIVPESEVDILSENCDTLLYLHADPYFFSLDQFYEEHSY